MFGAGSKRLTHADSSGSAVRKQSYDYNESKCGGNDFQRTQVQKLTLLNGHYTCYAYDGLNRLRRRRFLGTGTAGRHPSRRNENPAGRAHSGPAFSVPQVCPRPGTRDLRMRL